MNDYENTVIYKIICKDENIKEIYVGHTTDFLYRQWNHIVTCSNEKKEGHNNKLYTTIRANGGWKNWEMIEIESYPCANLEEARLREKYYYIALNATMNSIQPHLTKEEKKERNAKTNKAYYERNKERILALNKEYKKKTRLTKKTESNTK
jgi:hypothetical protein